MAPINYIKFSYLGINRYVICDLNTSYEEMQKLVALTFHLPEECITAIQFTDGLGHLYNKDLFEYFLILFPQPEQKFYIRLECSKVIENRLAYKEGKCAHFGITKNTNKRAHSDIQDTEDGMIYAAPVRRQNCFLGTLPDNESVSFGNAFDTNRQSSKRMRLMKRTRTPMKKCIKPPQPKRALRM